ncbi:hypothetical protein [Streptomyces ochraceiscleroticus]|uniref:Uncharacterized protein n=1 Tax=Streptomyces ochraceiscleroticus TaxID=47761 RepID=A0ABW1MSU9_9ACTN|nr:hypothetical protein [Streptomyces ochraceiscleroticus]
MTAALAFVLAFAFTPLGGVATADATRHGDDARKPIEVSIGASGIHAPDHARAGLVDFHVTTDDSEGRFLQAFRPRHGASVHKVLAHLAMAVGDNPAAAAKGVSSVRDEAELYGGAQVTPSVPATFTTPITAGTVVLLDFSAFLKDPTHPVIRTLELHGESSKGRADFPDSIVTTKETEDGPRFEVHGLRKAEDNILVHNASDEIHEMALQPVAPGTTDEQIQKAFSSTSAGAPPFTGPSLGLGAISPGRTALLSNHHLPPGTYALLCFVPDDETGHPHVAEGMHKVVVLK